MSQAILKKINHLTLHHPPSVTQRSERLSNQPILKSGQPNGQHLSVSDIHPNPCKTSVPLLNSQNLTGPFFRPKLAVSTTNTRLNSDHIQKNTSPAGYQLDITTSASEPGKYQTTSQGKTCQKAYTRSEKRKAYQRAYYKAFKNTGDRVKARIAGKQASTLIRESHKAKNL
ncbi:hypothetical protein [Endozoicomonas acroporae]|uniref:hypothetical protein n=1 Tax=Endozoicomonas acroporae TaxID=1701104 RepID=UPI003D7938AE